MWTVAELVTIDDIRSAARTIAGTVVRTPLLPCLWSDQERPLWIKPESLQATGAFKIRGALNAVAALTDVQRRRGIVAHSSGNHAQAVAYAAKLAGVRATIVMPAVAPAFKQELTRSHGAEIVLVPPPELAARTAALIAEHGYALVPPYDDPHVIAGQGTVGLEIATDAPDVDVVLVPVSGGGLSSGVAVALKALAPRARVVLVEPELAGDAAESLRTGERVAWTTDQTYRTMADGLRVPVLGELTWEHLRRYADAIITVTEDEIAEAVRVLARNARLVAEPSGAVTTAGYLFHAAELPAGRTVAVLSGGNVDPAAFAGMLGA